MLRKIEILIYGDCPEDHTPEQVCPLCGNPLWWPDLAAWCIGDSTELEICHRSCIEEALTQ